MFGFKKWTKKQSREELLADTIELGKIISGLEGVIYQNSQETADLLNVINELQEENEKLKASGAIPIAEGNSSILFEIDNELNVSTKSRINKDIAGVLVDNQYLDSTQSEDNAAIHLVFILLANEVTDQIMQEINENAN